MTNEGSGATAAGDGVAAAEPRVSLPALAAETASLFVIRHFSGPRRVGASFVNTLTTLSQVISLTASRPARPRRRASSGAWYQRSSAAANAAGSGGTTAPVSPSPTNSRIAPESVAVRTGLPAVKASTVA